MRSCLSSRLPRWSWALSAFAITSLARAEDSPATPTTSDRDGVAPPAAPPEARPRADELDRARALTLFEEAKERYRTGRFRESALRLKEAWSLAKEPVLLYNLARSCENAGYLMCAEETYTQYVALDANAEDLAAIKIRLDVLHDQIRERQDAARPAIAPWIIAGSGLLGLGVAATLGVVASDRHDEAEAEPEQLSAIALQDGAEQLATASTATFIVSGVVLAAGATWGVVDLATLGVAHDRLVDIALGPGEARLFLTF